jgi:hypothetical protein
MNVVRHDYKAYARPVNFVQLVGGKMNDYSLCAIIIKDPAPSVTGKGYEVGVAFSIIDLAPHCHSPLSFYTYPLALLARPASILATPILRSLQGSIQQHNSIFPRQGGEF